MDNITTLPACPPRPNLHLPSAADATEYEARFCQALRQDRWEAALRHPVLCDVVTSPLQLVRSTRELKNLQAMMPSATRRILTGVGRALTEVGHTVSENAGTIHGAMGVGLTATYATAVIAGPLAGVVLGATLGTGAVAALLKVLIEGGINGYQESYYDITAKRWRAENELSEIASDAETLEPPVAEHILGQLIANEAAFREAASLRHLYDSAVNELQTVLRRVEMADRHAARIASRLNGAA